MTRFAELRKPDSDSIPQPDKMLPEYDFSGGVRGKHVRQYRQGHTVKVRKRDGTVEVRYFTTKEGAVMLDPDLSRHFPDSKSVNKALRSLIRQTKQT
ncbi:MAG: hypothetical protein V2A74_00970 [bacterium]